MFTEPWLAVIDGPVAASAGVSDPAAVSAAAVAATEKAASLQRRKSALLICSLPFCGARSGGRGHAVGSPDALPSGSAPTVSRSAREAHRRLPLRDDRRAIARSPSPGLHKDGGPCRAVPFHARQRDESAGRPHAAAAKPLGAKTRPECPRP